MVTLASSSSWMTFIVTILGVVLLLKYIFTVFKKQDKCSGPTILETIHGLFKYRENLHIIFTKWAHQYGPIYTVFIGVERFFILSDVKMMKEAFAQNECSGRPKFVTLDPLFTGTKCIMATDGIDFYDQKNFALSTLKTFGFGSGGMTTLIMEEVASLLKLLEGRQNQVFFVKKLFLIPVVNALWIAIANKRFTEDDPQVPDMICDFLFKVEAVLRNPILVLNFEIAKLFPWVSTLREYRKSHKRVAQYFQEVIDEHKRTLPSGEPRDFIDAYLNKVASVENDEGSVFNKGTHLIDVLFDFVMAGADTSSLALEWTILYMILNPPIQKKVREELRRVVGRDRLPQLSDRPKLPYVDATLYETMRLSPVATASIPHKMLENYKFKNRPLVLPKNSNVTANLYLMLRDKKAWGENPDEFRPDRFLDEDGNLLRPLINENFVAFATGKRKCLGKNLALESMWLFFSGIFHKFELKCHPDYPQPTTEPLGGMLYQPQKFPALIQMIDDE